MKKTYINPEIEIIEIEYQQMLAASVQFGESINDASGADAPELPELPGIPPFVFE